jgi:hypothetical protein
MEMAALDPAQSLGISRPRRSMIIPFCHRLALGEHSSTVAMRHHIVETQLLGSAMRRTSESEIRPR